MNAEDEILWHGYDCDYVIATIHATLEVAIRTTQHIVLRMRAASSSIFIT